MNAKTLVAAQTRLPRAITLLVHSRAYVPMVTLQTTKTGVKVSHYLRAILSRYTNPEIETICKRFFLGNLGNVQFFHRGRSLK